MIITGSKTLRNNRTDLLLASMVDIDDISPVMRALIALTGKVDHFYNHMDGPKLQSWLLPPLRLGQYVCIREGEEIVAYTSWAYMNNEAKQRWLVDKKTPSFQDWKSGDEIWGIDAMAIDGKGTELSRLLRQTLRSKGHKGRYCHYTRRYPNGDFRVTRVLI